MSKHSKFIGLLSVAILVFCCFSGADAKIVKVNHSDLLAGLTPVPASSQEAFSKCVMDKENALNVNSSVKSVTDKLDAFLKENVIPYMSAPGSQANMPQNMPTKEQIKKMTREEKIALAMKMQAEMNNPPAPKNTAAWAKTIELNNKFTELFSKDPLTNKLMDVEMRYNPQHDRINDETNASVDKCPVLSSGEMSAPDEKCVKAKKLAGVDKHIALAAKELGELRTLLAWHTGRIKDLLVELDQLMKEVNYGDAEDDEQSKTMLNQVQGLALQQLSQMQGVSQNAYINAAQWIVEKQRINENK